MPSSSKSKSSRSAEFSASGGHDARRGSILKNGKLQRAASTMDFKKVWFDTVEIKYHQIILGDNPSVTDGAPITIHWKSHDRKIVDVDEFEDQFRKSTSTGTSGKSSSKKVNKDLRMSVTDRAAILLGNGYSLAQIAKKTQQVHEIQRERRKSAASSVKWDGFNQALESSGRVFRRLAQLNVSGGNGSDAGGKKMSTANPAA